MLKVLDLRESELPCLGEPEALVPPPPGVLRWIDIENPTLEVLEQLRKPFGLHPLAIEDCLTFEQRPKLEEYTGHVFVVIHELSGRTEDIVGNEIHAFLGPNFLITVHTLECQRINQVFQRVLVDRSVYARGMGFVYYLVADSVATRNTATIDALSDTLDELEELILHKNDSEALPRVFELKRAVAAARRALSPQRDLLSSLTRVDSHLVSERTAFYFRDVYDKLVRTNESLDSCRELLSNLLDAHFSMISQRTNQIMKHLTALSAIFLPLTFVTGFFGQNFEYLPFGSKTLLWVSLGSCLLVPLGMLFFFRRKRWL